jgi:hypothetical protein
VGFEPTISVLERAKTVRALDRAVTAMREEIKVKLSLQQAVEAYKVVRR